MYRCVVSHDLWPRQRRVMCRMDPALFTNTSLSKRTSIILAPSDRMWLGKKRGTARGVMNCEMPNCCISMSNSDVVIVIESRGDGDSKTMSSNPFVSVSLNKESFAYAGRVVSPSCTFEPPVNVRTWLSTQ